MSNFSCSRVLPPIGSPGPAAAFAGLGAPRAGSSYTASPAGALELDLFESVAYSSIDNGHLTWYIQSKSGAFFFVHSLSLFLPSNPEVMMSVTREEALAFLAGCELSEKALLRIRVESADPGSDVSQVFREVSDLASRVMDLDVGPILHGSFITTEDEELNAGRDQYFPPDFE